MTAWRFLYCPFLLYGDSSEVKVTFCILPGCTPSPGEAAWVAGGPSERVCGLLTSTVIVTIKSLSQKNNCRNQEEEEKEMKRRR